MDTRHPDPRRAAIEEELRERLANDRAPGDGSPAPVPEAAPATSPQLTPGPASIAGRAIKATLSGVGLVCLACRGLSSADAAFCTKCGIRFNVLVVAASNPDAARGGAR